LVESVGADTFAGGSGRTALLAPVLEEAVPIVFVAVTSALSVCPTSLLVGV
jgi:hypothetical protein